MKTNKAGPAERAAEKTKLREELLCMRRSLPPGRLADVSLRAGLHILNLPAWQSAGQVLLYCSANGELDTGMLIDNALGNGKTVLLPRCISGKKGCMEFAPCQNRRELRAGPFGILEPNPETCPATEICSLHPQLAIIPGLAFTPEGLRLGYGGGYYDRFLAETSLEGCLLIGFCAGFQVVEFLPQESWDRKMDAVCNENGIFYCARSRAD